MVDSRRCRVRAGAGALAPRKACRMREKALKRENLGGDRLFMRGSPPPSRPLRDLSSPQTPVFAQGTGNCGTSGGLRRENPLLGVGDRLAVFRRGLSRLLMTRARMAGVRFAPGRCLLLLLLLALLLSGCRSTAQAPDTHATEQEVLLTVEMLSATPVYGLHVEYLVDDAAAGGLAVIADPLVSRAFADGETLCIGIPLPVETGEPAETPFRLGMQVFVICRDGSALSLGSVWEWEAVRGREYPFVLRGSLEAGMTLWPAAEFGCAVSPAE